MKISVIIPTYNENGFIRQPIERLLSGKDAQAICEVIVVDGCSTDGTREQATERGAAVFLHSVKGRASQMNYGASVAIGDVLYFLHADTLPPENFATDILVSVQEGHDAGCFRLAFDHPHWFLKFNCWFTRFNIVSFRFGDQSLFVTKKLFAQVGGFDEKHIVLEDQEIVNRLKKLSSFIVLKRAVKTSARKYLHNGIYKTQGIFFLIYFMYKIGYSQQKLVATYRRLIKQDKL